MRIADTPVFAARELSGSPEVLRILGNNGMNPAS